MVVDISNSKLDAIIFDLGGVIINLYEERTFEAFAKMGQLTIEEVAALASREEYFKKYETGAVDDPAFRKHLRASLPFEGDEVHLDEAWNAMLGAIPRAKLDLLEKLRSDYKLFVMSNTNAIHVKRFLQIADQVSPDKAFFNYFDKVYLSHEIGERKPNPGAWQVILDEQPIIADRTLFIDDKEENILAATKLGLQVFHNTCPDNWMKLFT